MSVSISQSSSFIDIMVAGSGQLFLQFHCPALETRAGLLIAIENNCVWLVWDM